MKLIFDGIQLGTSSGNQGPGYYLNSEVIEEFAFDTDSLVFQQPQLGFEPEKVRQITGTIIGTDLEDVRVRKETLYGRGRGTYEFVLIDDVLNADGTVTDLRKYRFNARVAFLQASLEFISTFAEYNMQIVSVDPYILGFDTQSVTAFLEVSGGFPIPAPIPFPLGTGTISVGGETRLPSVNLINEGHIENYASFKINGPVQNPTISNITTGKSFAINATIPAGQFVRVFKTFEGVFILLNDVTNYRRFFETDFFSIAKGNNLIRFTSAVYNADANVEVTYNSAFLGI